MSNQVAMQIPHTPISHIPGIDAGQEGNHESTPDDDGNDSLGGDDRERLLTNTIMSSLELHDGRESVSSSSLSLKTFSRARILYMIALVVLASLFLQYHGIAPDSQSKHFEEEEDHFKEVMQQLRSWPVDQTFQVTDHCQYDLLEEIRNQTIRTHCQCENPTQPQARRGEEWQAAFRQNQALAREATADLGDRLDVVLLGDSITEHWCGTAMGEAKARFAEHHRVYQEILTRQGGGVIDALPLAVAADQTPQLLYRIREGGFAELLKPKVWWILIGSNDLSMGLCNVDMVVAGNVAVVEEIRKTQPTAVIVLNSLLPRLPSPLQPYLDNVNQRLEHYASQIEGLHFFNATDIFVDSKGRLEHLPDGVHPDADISVLWAHAIVRKVQDLSD